MVTNDNVVSEITSEVKNVVYIYSRSMYVYTVLCCLIEENVLCE